MFLAITRVSDYYHHIIDVLVGFSLGMIIGILVGRHNIRWLQTIDDDLSLKTTLNSECVMESGATNEAYCQNGDSIVQLNDVAIASNPKSN